MALLANWQYVLNEMPAVDWLKLLKGNHSKFLS